MASSAPKSSLHQTGEIAAVIVKRAGVGAFVTARWLTLHRYGNRTLAALCALALLWGLEHPRTVVQVQHDVAHDVVAVSAPAAHAATLSRPIVRPAGNPIASVLLHCSPTTLAPAGPHGDLCRRAWQGNPAGAIWTLPSISVQAIQHAWWAAGSPFADQSQRYSTERGDLYPAEYLYDAAQAAGIDPAFVMAMFHHESHYGTAGMAALTGSVGNIRCHAALACLPINGGYTAYHNPFQAIDDVIALLWSYRRHGLLTPAQVISVWAPPSDSNDTPAYIASVRDTMQQLAGQ